MTDRVLLAFPVDSVATLTLNRPQVHNAMDREMIQSLTHHFQELSKNSNLRALVLKGEGKTFCAGADLEWMRTQEKEDTDALSHMLHLLDTLPFPSLCLVQGAAIGGGLGLLACADIVLADPTATFRFSEVKLGLVPAIVSPYVLRAIGPRFARRYFLTGEAFSANEAHRMGLIHEVMDKETLEARSDEIFTQIQAAGPNAVREAKALIREFTPPITESIRERVCDLLQHVRTSDEGQAGIAAFFDKRLPPWNSND